jgi:hypothetical protein
MEFPETPIPSPCSRARISLILQYKLPVATRTEFVAEEIDFHLEIGVHDGRAKAFSAKFSASSL